MDDAPLVRWHRLESNGPLALGDAVGDPLGQALEALLAPSPIAADIKQHPRPGADPLVDHQADDVLERRQRLALAADQDTKVGAGDVERDGRRVVLREVELTAVTHADAGGDPHPPQDILEGLLGDLLELPDGGVNLNGGAGWLILVIVLVLVVVLVLLIVFVLVVVLVILVVVTSDRCGGGQGGDPHDRLLGAKAEDTAGWLAQDLNLDLVPLAAELGQRQSDCSTVFA
jgi:hypothetical protein